MGRTVLIRVDESLVGVFGNISKSFEDKIKKEYGLKELFIPNTMASQLLAGRYSGKEKFNFKVLKTSRDKGILQLIG